MSFLLTAAAALTMPFAQPILMPMSLQGATAVLPPKADENGLAAQYGSGVCRVSVFGKDKDGERLRAEFSRRLRDGNLSISLYGPFINAYRSKDVNTNHNVTVAFDTGSSAPSRSGGYDTGGFRESVWGGWGPGAASGKTYKQLKKASSFSVKMDGNTFGPFTWNGKGAVYNALDLCEEMNS